MAELTVPQLNFASLGDLPQVYRENKNRAASDLTLASLGRGELNYNQAAAQLMASDPQRALALVGLANNQRDYDFRTTEAARTQANVDRAFVEGQRQFNTGQDATRIPAGFEPDPAKPGALRPRTGGPQDPAYINEVRKPQTLSVTDITKLSEEGGKFANLTGFINEFQNDYSGKPLQGLSNAAARNLPAALTGEKERQVADWWQGYDAYKNKVRNDLFGSALTPSEQSEWLKSDIHPGMPHELVKKNLTRQQQIVQAGIQRRASAMVQGGYDAETIAKAYGIPPEQLGVKSKKQAAAQGGDPLAAARDAIAKGAPREAVIQRLQQNGINPSGL